MTAVALKKSEPIVRFYEGYEIVDVKIFKLKKQAVVALKCHGGNPEHKTMIISLESGDELCSYFGKDNGGPTTLLLVED